MKPTVFIHTNHKQYIGALVGAHSFKRMSASPDTFDVKLIHTDDHAFMRAQEGKPFMRGGKRHVWKMNDLQSFTPLRFMPPELMGYEGRAIIVDPDIFAVGDVAELFARDMQGKAMLCCNRSDQHDGAPGYSTSSMLLDCSKLRHWHVETQFKQLFDRSLDYQDWIELKKEDPAIIGRLERVWNDYDRLTPETKLLHNTKRRTQPWKTGLPIDFTEAYKFRVWPPKGWIRTARRRIFGEYAMRGTYLPHADPSQERFFFALLADALNAGAVDRQLVECEMRANNLRHDALDMVERLRGESETPSVAFIVPTAQSVPAS